jgi:glycosyltransferase involved in cell wall biosynthesis
MNILFLNHTAAASGAELALMRLIEGLRAEHSVALACPDDGPLGAQADSAGIRRFSVPAFEASLRPDLLQTPVGLVRLGAGGIAVRRVAPAFGADLVHANTTRAGLIGAVARRLGGPPLVVRAHEHLPPSRVGRSIRALIVRRAAAVVAVSDFTAPHFNEGLTEPVAVRVYNSIDHSRFDPQRVAPAPIREELGLDPGAHLIGHVAQITSWKRQDVSIRALAELRARGLDVHLLLVGQVAFGGKHVRLDNHAYLHSLEELVDELSVRQAVHFLGQRNDVPELMRALDLSLLPSEQEPFGLVTVESMALGTPPLVCADGAGPELVDDRETGRVLASAEPKLWADAIHDLLVDRPQLDRMAERGPVAAARFRDDVQAAEMLAVYGRVTGSAGTGIDVAVPAGAPPKQRVGATWPS